MKGFKELVGILLLIQGIGGGISAAIGGSRSWFAVRYLLPQDLQVPAAVIVALVGAVLVWQTRERSRS